MPSFSGLSPQKRAFLAGTLLLTATGFACRILGFFYRIFLSRTIGAEGLGLYNMVHPVFSICFSVCAGSIQTALSQYIASHVSQGKKVFRSGLAVSMLLSILMALGISHSSHWIACHILLEERCAPLLPIIALSVPFAAFHACINGYYYGMQKSRVPAFSQVAEQVVRMGLVFLIADIWMEQGREITVELAVLGHLIGEIASACFTLCALCLVPPQKIASAAGSLSRSSSADFPVFHHSASWLSLSVPLMALALPLMGNRLVLNLLGSAEAIWIPSRLQAFGLNSEEAFSIYGVLAGMAMPFILFPSAITNSMAVLLLPAVAKAQSAGNEERISNTISMAIRYSLYMGIFCVGIFRILWTFPGNQRFSRFRCRNLYLHPGLALSFHVSCHHHGKHLKRPWQNLYHLCTEYCSYGSSPGICDFRDSPLRNPGLSVGTFRQRNPAGLSEPCFPVPHCRFFLGAMGNLAETGLCSHFIHWNLPRPAFLSPAGSSRSPLSAGLFECELSRSD